MPPIDLTEHLPGASRLVRTVPICLRGDLLGALEDAEAQLLDAQALLDETTAQVGDAPATLSEAGRGRRRLAELGAAVDAATERAQAARADVRAASLPFRVRGLDRPGWVLLEGQHPARPGNDLDARLGYNHDTFPPALLRQALVDPHVADDAQWAALEKALTYGQSDTLVAVAMEASRRKADIPFSSPASGGTPSSAAT